MSLVWICPESFSTLRSVKAKISSDICSVQLRKYDVSGFGRVRVRPGSAFAKIKDQPSANQQIQPGWDNPLDSFSSVKSEPLILSVLVLVLLPLLLLGFSFKSHKSSSRLFGLVTIIIIGDIGI